MPAEGLCEFLEWDSSFFGLRIARAAGDILDAKRLAEMEGWCERQRIDCLYFLARPEDSNTSHFAEVSGFRLVDVRVTLEWEALPRPPVPTAVEDEAGLRLARADDTAALQEAARRNHHDTRFYADERFPRHLCDLLYATWIARSLEGYADAVWVAEEAGKPVGYITCHLDRETATGRIGLMGVNDGMRGRGIGSLLVKGCAAWFREHGARIVKVTTQGRNLAAQRIYQRCGFVTASVGLWYHRWFR